MPWTRFWELSLGAVLAYVEFEAVNNKSNIKLIKRIKDTPVEDIESGKVTQEQCPEWIKELQYESIAIADLFTDGKNNQKERLKNIEGKL